MALFSAADFTQLRMTCEKGNGRNTGCDNGTAGLELFQSISPTFIQNTDSK
jgi:hypothetical protein